VSFSKGKLRGPEFDFSEESDQRTQAVYNESIYRAETTSSALSPIGCVVANRYLVMWSGPLRNVYTWARTSIRAPHGMILGRIALSQSLSLIVRHTHVDGPTGVHQRRIRAGYCERVYATSSTSISTSGQLHREGTTDLRTWRRHGFVAGDIGDLARRIGFARGRD
jgi:hypothetical protein